MSRIMSEKDDVFPAKLHCLLENKRFYDILRWSEKDCSFEVLQPRRLVKKVLPVVFNQTQWASFQRQLNIYGFRKVATKKSIRSYFHPSFRPGRRDLVANILRVAIKSKAQSLKVDSEEEEEEYSDGLDNEAVSGSSLSFAAFEQFPPLDGSYFPTTALNQGQGVVFGQSDCLRYSAPYFADVRGFPDNFAVAASSPLISNVFYEAYPAPAQPLMVNNHSQTCSVFPGPGYHAPLMYSLDSSFLHHPASSFRFHPPALVSHSSHDNHDNTHYRYNTQYYRQNEPEEEEDLGSFLLEFLEGDEDADCSSFSSF